MQAVVVGENTNNSKMVEWVDLLGICGRFEGEGVGGETPTMVKTKKRKLLLINEMQMLQYQRS